MGTRIGRGRQLSQAWALVVGILMVLAVIAYIADHAPAKDDQ